MTGRSLIKRPEHSLTVQIEPEIREAPDAARMDARA